MADWAERNQCGHNPTRILTHDEVHCDAYPDCADGAETVLCTIEGGGHTWPGPPNDPSLAAVLAGPFGKTSEVISANDFMWEFFTRHPLVTCPGR
jgi:polyhydroxybutyrate depolymerase